MFTIELRKPDSLNSDLGPAEIHLDRLELEQLIVDLQELQRTGNSPFYTTEGWGAGDLDSKTVGDGNILIHMLKIYLYDNSMNQNSS